MILYNANITYTIDLEQFEMGSFKTQGFCSKPIHHPHLIAIVQKVLNLLFTWTENDRKLKRENGSNSIAAAQ